MTDIFFNSSYGRKIIFVLCILLLAVSGVAQAFSPDYYTFQLFVFLNAMGTAGVFPLAFVLGKPNKLIIICTLHSTHKIRVDFFSRVFYTGGLGEPITAA